MNELTIQDWQIKQISIFTQKGLALKEEAEKLQLLDAPDLPAAQGLKKKIQALEKEIEQERKVIIFPFQDFIKQLNNLAAECLIPTEQAKLTVSQKLLAYDEKMETQRREAAEKERQRLLKEEAEKKAREEEEARLRKIEEDRLEGIKKAQEEERQKIAQEQDANKRAQQELEARKLAEEAKLEAQRVEIQRKQREMEETQRQIDLQKEELANKEQEGDSDRKNALNKVKGIRTSWTYIIEDENKVPRELCSPDSKKINAAIKTGLRIANGLEIFQEKRIQ